MTKNIFFNQITIYIDILPVWGVNHTIYTLISPKRAVCVAHVAMQQASYQWKLSEAIHYFHQYSHINIKTLVSWCFNIIQSTNIYTFINICVIHIILCFFVFVLFRGFMGVWFWVLLNVRSFFFCVRFFLLFKQCKYNITSQIMNSKPRSLQIWHYKQEWNLHWSRSMNVYVRFDFFT